MKKNNNNKRRSNNQFSIGDKIEYYGGLKVTTGYYYCILFFIALLNTSE